MCDGRFDCLDKSDEFDCINFKIKSRFRNHLKSNPPPSNEKAEKLKIVIHLDMSDINIIEVSSTLSARFKVTLEWAEPREEFFDLKQDEGSNQLTKQELRDIWMPNLMFHYTRNLQTLNFTSPMYAKVKINNGSTSVKNSMDVLWNGYSHAGKDWYSNKFIMKVTKNFLKHSFSVKLLWQSTSR